MIAGGAIRGAHERRRSMLALVALVVRAVPDNAAAAPVHILRFATAAPDGTEWARLSRTFAREIEEEKQGMHRIEVGKGFRSDFLDAARAARLELGAALASPALLDEINGWLADYRSDHQ